jgi:hypothetical protein
VGEEEEECGDYLCTGWIAMKENGFPIFLPIDFLLIFLTSSLLLEKSPNHHRPSFQPISPPASKL